MIHFSWYQALISSLPHWSPAIIAHSEAQQVSDGLLGFPVHFLRHADVCDVQTAEGENLTLCIIDACTAQARVSTKLMGMPGDHTLRHLQGCRLCIPASLSIHSLTLLVAMSGADPMLALTG